MSANTLLVNGKINPSLLPPSGTLPTDPQFNSITTTGGAGLTINNPTDATDQFELFKGTDGSVRMLYDNLHNLMDATLETNQLQIVFADSDSVNTYLAVAGSAGEGQVNDTLYNPVFLAVPGAFFTNDPLPSSGQYEAQQSRLYNLQITFQVSAGGSIGNGYISCALTLDSAVVFSNNITASQFAVPATGTANFVFSSSVFLTASETYFLNITPVGSGTWSGITATAQIA
jgi:hypothetical protein